MRRVDTQVAFLRLANGKIPLDPHRREWAVFDTRFATDAKFLVDHPDIAELGAHAVGLDRCDRAGIHAGSVLALAAGDHEHVVGQIPNESCWIWIRARVYEATPEWAMAQAIMQVPHPWHFFRSTRRYPSEVGMARSSPGTSRSTPAATAKL